MKSIPHLQNEPAMMTGRKGDERSSSFSTKDLIVSTSFDGMDVIFEEKKLKLDVVNNFMGGGKS